MKCPYCGHLGDKVVDSRESREGDVIRRRRQCLGCAKRFTSRERIEEIGARLMQELKQLDQIAYVRFASVYRQFRDVGQFKREVDELQKVDPKVKPK